MAYRIDRTKFTQGKTQYFRVDDKGRLIPTKKPRTMKGGPAMRVTAVDYDGGTITVAVGLAPIARKR